MDQPAILLVTGASRGIGRTVARTLVERSSNPTHVVLSARGAADLEAAASEVGAAAPPGVTVRVSTQIMDCGDPTSIRTGMAAIREDVGRVDAAILNAGVAESAPLHRTSDEMFERMLAVNLGGVFRVMREVLPGMREQGFGRIVAIASIAAKAGAPYIGAYCASKHGVLGLVRAAALEYAAEGITVNAVCPGYVETPMTERAIDNICAKTGRSRGEALQHILSTTPQRRLFRPEEVAAAVCFLVSPEARGINGVGLELDGGELAR